MSWSIAPNLTLRAPCNPAIFFWQLACSSAQRPPSSCSRSRMVSEAGWPPCSSLCPSYTIQHCTDILDSRCWYPGTNDQPALCVTWDKFSSLFPFQCPSFFLPLPLFRDRVSLHSPDWPQTRCAVFSVILSAGMPVRTPDWLFLLSSPPFSLLSSLSLTVLALWVCVHTQLHKFLTLCLCFLPCNGVALIIG